MLAQVRARVYSESFFFLSHFSLEFSLLSQVLPPFFPQGRMAAAVPQATQKDPKKKEKEAKKKEPRHCPIRPQTAPRAPRASQGLPGLPSGVPTRRVTVCDGV